VSPEMRLSAECDGFHHPLPAVSLCRNGSTDTSGHSLACIGCMHVRESGGPCAVVWTSRRKLWEISTTRSDLAMKPCCWISSPWLSYMASLGKMTEMRDHSGKSGWRT